MEGLKCNRLCIACKSDAITHCKSKKHYFCTHCQVYSQNCLWCNCTVCQTPSVSQGPCNLHTTCEVCIRKYPKRCFGCTCQICGKPADARFPECKHPACHECISRERCTLFHQSDPISRNTSNSRSSKSLLCHICKQASDKLIQGLCGSPFCEKCVKYLGLDSCPQCAGMPRSKCEVCGGMDYGHLLSCSHFYCIQHYKDYCELCTFVCIACKNVRFKNKRCEHKICDDCYVGQDMNCYECNGYFICECCGQWGDQKSRDECCGCPFCLGYANCPNCAQWKPKTASNDEVCLECAGYSQCIICKNLRAIEDNGGCVDCNRH